MFTKSGFEPGIFTYFWQLLLTPLVKKLVVSVGVANVKHFFKSSIDFITILQLGTAEQFIVVCVRFYITKFNENVI